MPRDIGELIPRLAASLPDRQYAEEANIVSFWMDDVYLMVFPRKVLVHRVADLKQAQAALAKLDQMLLRLAKRRASDRKRNGG